MAAIKNSIILEVRNLKETLYFYEGILGFQFSKDRPQLAVPGIWYDVGSVRLCFIVNATRNESSANTLPAQIHLQLPITEMERIQQKLAFYCVAYEEIVDTHRKKPSIIVRDPDQYQLQIEPKCERK